MKTLFLAFALIAVLAASAAGEETPVVEKTYLNTTLQRFEVNYSKEPFFYYYKVPNSDNKEIAFKIEFEYKTVKDKFGETIELEAIDKITIWINDWQGRGVEGQTPYLETYFDILNTIIKFDDKEKKATFVLGIDKNIDDKFKNGLLKLWRNKIAEGKSREVYRIYVSKVKVLEIKKGMATLQVETEGKKEVIKLKEGERTFLGFVETIGVEKLDEKKREVTIVMGREETEQLAEVEYFDSMIWLNNNFNDLELGSEITYRFGQEKRDLRIKFVDLNARNEAAIEAWHSDWVNEDKICESTDKSCWLRKNQVNQYIGEITGAAFLLTDSITNEAGTAILYRMKPYMRENEPEIKCKPLLGFNNGRSEDKLDVLIVPGDGTSEPNGKKYELKEESDLYDFLSSDFDKHMLKAIEALYSIPAVNAEKDKINWWYVDDPRLEAKCNKVKDEFGLENWECQHPDIKYWCQSPDRTMVFIPDSTPTGISWVQFADNYGISEVGENTNVAPHELAHLLFDLDDTYAGTGGYSEKEANAYLGLCDRGEKLINQRWLIEEYKQFKKGKNYYGTEGKCVSFEPDQRIYPQVPFVSVLQPTDLMGHGYPLYLNFDAEYQVKTVMREFK